MPAVPFGPLAVVLFLVVVNGFFALAEFALVSVRPTQVRALLNRGAAGAEPLRRLTRDPGRFLSTIQVAITLSGFLASASATAVLADRLAATLARSPLPAGWAGGLAVFLVTFGVSYLSLVFGELVPKQIALHQSERVALRVAAPVEWLARLLHPFVALVSGSSRLVLSLVGIGPATPRPRLSEEELRQLVVEQKTLEEEEKELIEGVFAFGDVLVREIMVPRADVVALAADTPVEEAVELVRATGFSRFPVYEGDLDQILGLVTAKDLLAALIRGGERRPVRALARETLFVPESKRALDLLAELRDRRVHLAVVVDEYGSTAGIVTSEDLLEEIVGEIRDETDFDEEEAIVPVGEGEARVAGTVRLEDVNEALDLNLPTDGPYETLAGFLLTRFERIPAPGESLLHDGTRLTVEAVEGRRIERVRVEKVGGREPPAGPGAPGPGEPPGAPDPAGDRAGQG